MGLITDLHSTAALLEKELTAFEKKAPAIEKVIDSSLAYISPVLQLALTDIGDPAAATAVGAIVTKANNDLNAASALVADFGPTPTAASIFSAVSNNLSTILTDTNVKSATTTAAITKAVSEVGVLAASVSTAAAAVKSSASGA